jgi:hypothetical protein
MTHCAACGKPDGLYAHVPHYDTWAEFAAAVKLHRFDDFAAWQKTHAAWMQQQQRGVK